MQNMCTPESTLKHLNLYTKMINRLHKKGFVNLFEQNPNFFLYAKWKLEHFAFY
jgi:hypothetical protein